jgi:hypothetical protein
VSVFGNSFALGFLPVAAVEKSRGFEARSVDFVEAAPVDCDSVRLGTRYVERVHSADTCCEAWNWLLAETGRIRSLCSYPWLKQVSS